MTETASSVHPTPREEKQTVAIFMPKTDENGRVLSDSRQRSNKLTVHFNPETLDITFTNSVRQGRRNQPAQVSVTETTAKLSMELIFDTTLNGIDVRVETNKLGRMMDPAQQRPRQNNRSNQIPSIVIFQWGTIWFEGYIDSYRERLDFFSAEGVPLRAAVTLSLTQQQRDFAPNTNVSYNNTVGGSGDPLSSNAPINRVGSNRSITDAVSGRNSAAAGNSAVARSVAAANGIENMRLPEVNELVFPDVQLSRQAGSRLAAGGSGAGMNLSVQGGAHVGADAKQSTAGLFANLKQSGSGSAGASVGFTLESHFDVEFGQGANMSLGLGGGLDVGGSASMSADVGISADIETGIHFEE